MKRPMVDRGVFAYHPLRKKSEFRAQLQELLIPSLCLLSDWNAAPLARSCSLIFRSAASIHGKRWGNNQKSSQHRRYGLDNLSLEQCVKNRDHVRYLLLGSVRAYKAAGCCSLSFLPLSPSKPARTKKALAEATTG